MIDGSRRDRGHCGNFAVTIETTPRHVNTNCTACGECANAAKTEAPNPFNYGLDKIKAAYLP